MSARYNVSFPNAAPDSGLGPVSISTRDELLEVASRAARRDVEINRSLYIKSSANPDDRELEEVVTRCAVTMVNKLWPCNSGQPTYHKSESGVLAMLERVE